MDDPSRQWVDRASRGDTEAIEALLRENLPRLHAYFRLRSGALVLAHESSADLVQSVCREVLQGLSGFEYRGPAQFRAWLFTAAARKIADRYEYYMAQKRAAHREVPLDEHGGDAHALAELYASVATPSRALSEREDLARFERAFSQLTDEKREVILLARFAGLTSAEIGERMGKTDMAVRAMLRRALAELAVRLDPPVSR